MPAGRSGRQLIYAIWQRSDSPEAFYSCSDVVFDGSGSAPTSTPAVPGTVPPAPSGPATAAPSQAGHPAGHDHTTAAAPAPAAAVTTPAAATTQAAAAPPAPASSATSGTSGTPSAPATSAADSAADSAAAERLAQTGSDRSLGILASVGSAFLLAGATVAVLHRQRRGRGAHAR
ncbi:lytic polysaccharide monooxygenase [Kitasatospora sp. NPDC056181]|uniref:lytic polysaccharide monooxygenase n=1 Tax=Kitasatospora sp. NPDC056181 TaxID=3345737 RepID=UPI0035E1498B